MSKVETSAEVAASPEKIWAFICDANRYPEWVVPTDRMLEVPDEAMGVGYVYKEHGGVPPFKADSEWRVTVFEPHRRPARHQHDVCRGRAQGLLDRLVAVGEQHRL